MSKRGSSDQKEKSEEETAVEMWKMKKLIRTLEEARGNGTSMISLIVPPKDQISRVSKMLGDEYGTASNIKSRVNRLSVLGAITSVQQRLKLYNKVPPNGLVVFCGAVITEEGKEKKVNIDFEPFKPINTSLYLCDNKFHTEALAELLQDDEKFGFIVMDGNGALFGTVTGSAKNVLHQFSVDLPKKHGRGGQSAARFGRLRLEKRHNYVRKVAEMATSLYISNDRPNVSGLILAGSADFKNKLAGSDLFDQRLAKIVIKIVDVAYGGHKGFQEAIAQSDDALKDLKFNRERKLLMQFMSEISRDTGLFCYGVKETLIGLDMGAVDTLILWENLDINRYVLRHPLTGEEIIKQLTPAQAKDSQHFRGKQNVELDVVEKEPLIEWFAQHFKEFGAKLAFVSDRSQEGSQFTRGFGGIGALLRYKVPFEDMDEPEEWESDDFDDDDFM